MRTARNSCKHVLSSSRTPAKSSHPQTGACVQLVAMHMLGDVPTVPVLGWIQDRVHNWRYAF